MPNTASRPAATLLGAACLLGSALLAQQPAVAADAYDNRLPEEARSQALCESEPDRIFVRAGKASECVAYFVTAGREKLRTAVLFFDGDISLEKYKDQAAIARGSEARHRFMQTWADRTGQRLVDVSRLGVNGSSGNHGARRMPHETIIMNEAVSLLKARLGLDKLVLAGQSGGSTIAASLLTFGRKDIACAVLGSGAYEIVDLDYNFRISKGVKVKREALARVMYDPSLHVDNIEPTPGRRIFVLGDEADSRTPYDQQLRFTNNVRAAGHHARIYPIDAGGETDHDAARMTIPVAAVCARGDSDEKIYRGIPKPAASTQARSAGKPAKPSPKVKPQDETEAEVASGGSIGIGIGVP